MLEDLSKSDKKELLSQISDLESKLYKLKKELAYYMEINESSITRVKKDYKNMSAEFSVSAESIKSEVNKTIEATKEDLSSKIEQTANSITSTVSSRITEEVADKTQGFATKDDISTAKTEIKQTTDSITSTVTKITGDVDGLTTFKSKFVINEKGFILDGEKTVFDSIIYLARKTETEDNCIYENRFEFFYDNSQDERYNQVFFGGVNNYKTMINIGNRHSEDVCDDVSFNNCGIIQFGSGNKVNFSGANVNFSGATVSGLGNITATAVFG